MLRTGIAVGLAVAASLGPGQQTFRTSTDLVTLPVTVMGRDKALVRGLTKDDFEVFEDGRRQTITQFAEGALGRDVPLHLGLLLDISGSMERELADAARAAIRFVNALDEAADVTFVDFATEIRVSQFQPNSYPYLFERIRSNKAEGSTALYDAVGLYLESARRQEGQKVLLLYTDGEDSTSSLSYGRMLEMLRLSDVMVYAIGYVEYKTGRGVPQARLNDLSHQSGGEAFYPLSREQLDEIYDRIRDELASRYTLGYVSANRKKDGTWRKLEVKVSAKGAGNVKVRTRPGYFAPIQ